MFVYGMYSDEKNVPSATAPAKKSSGRRASRLSSRESDGGVYMQIETISLTRSIPPGLGWVVGPFVEKVPRESLEFTLRATCAALRKSPEAAPEQEQKKTAP